MLGDTQKSDNCDYIQAGCDSPALLNHTSSTDDSSLQSLLLEEVDLHGNRLTCLPSWLFLRFPFLQRVDVSQNRLDSLPCTVWACTSLLELNVASNCLSSLSSGHVESVSLTLDGDVDQQRPATPLSCTSEASSDVVTVVSATDQQCLSVVVHRLERWRDHIEVRPISYFAGSSARSSQVEQCRSRLKELDLAHNDFDEVPSILPCVAPSLERLNLSHNRLTRFGSVDCYPPSLRLLDLSHNHISVMDLTEDCHSATSTMTTPVTIPAPSTVSNASGHCHSPFTLKRSVITLSN